MKLTVILLHFVIFPVQAFAPNLQHSLQSSATSISAIGVQSLKGDELVALFNQKMVDPNSPSTSSEKELREKITSLLSIGWSARDGFEIPTEQIEELDLMMSSEDGAPRPSTYGEITELGSRQLFHYMGLIPISADSGCEGDGTTNEDLIFVDLGCGSGKLMIQAYVELPSVQKFMGVELAQARYAAAAQAWENLEKDATELRLQVDKGTEGDIVSAEVDIREGDLFELDISSATHIYVASLCFTDAMLDKLAKKIIDEGDKLIVVATIKPFPEKFNDRLGEPNTEFLEMSWTEKDGKGSPVNFYFPKKK